MDGKEAALFIEVPLLMVKSIGDEPLDGGVMTKDLNSQGDIYDIDETEENGLVSEMTQNEAAMAKNICTNIELNKNASPERVHTENLGSGDEHYI